MAPVKMYSTASCPYCSRARQLLHSRGVEHIEEISIEGDAAARAAMIELTQRRTVPQIFIGQRHVGGCDDLFALDQRGALMPLLEG
ncbi:MAG: glutaredoxin 3 [Variovorax sp.]